MTKRKTMPIIIIASLCFCVIFVFLVVLNKKPVEQDSSKQEVTEKVVMSGSYPLVSLEEVFEQSTLVIRGKVVSISDSFKIRPVGDDEGQNIGVFTDYYIEPVETFRGEALGGSITVRTRGGIYENLEEIDKSEPLLIEGNEYILMLYKPELGGGYNLDEDYYYPNYGFQGVYNISSANQSVNTTDLTLIKQSPIQRDQPSSTIQNIDAADTISMIAFKNIAQDINKSKRVPLDSQRDLFIETEKNNLETGVITREEYDRNIKEVEQYAERIA